VAALGDARAANCQYRKVLLTAAEAKMLREGNWEARAICARPWLKNLLQMVPAIPLVVTLVLLSRGASASARLPFLASVVLFTFLAAPFLPVYTPWRARVYRAVKWAALVAVFVLAFGADSLKYSWLIASCLWIPIWTEAKRMSIRRKLPVAEWPKQLYL
jgi:prepilin signal peptidase PulO-like enzyme (type II secretory pathway)